MTNEQVWSAVVRWLRARTGVTTIKSHEGGKAPAVNYVMVNFTGFFEVRENAIDVTYSDGADPPGDDLPPVTATPIIEGEWRFSVHAYGGSPTDTLRPIVSAVKLAQMHEPLMPGLVIHEISQVRNVPDWINEQWQPRAQMDLVVRGIVADGHIIDVIEETTFDIARA